jgi:hypothetical protein
MEKFNIDRALAGEPVITRDGKEVTQLVYFHDVIHKYCVYGVVGDQVKTWCIDGKFFYDDPSERNADLFMKPKENAIWINVYKRSDGGLIIDYYDSEAETKEDALLNNYIKTVKIDDKID